MSIWSDDQRNIEIEVDQLLLQKATKNDVANDIILDMHENTKKSLNIILEPQSDIQNITKEKEIHE